ncbi:MAG: toprim domain-containing protein [Candidatus Methanomethylicaceae archaeon]
MLLTHEFFKKSIFEPAGEKVLDYLRGVRKYDDDLIKAMELGAYVDRDGLIRFLNEKGFTEDEIRLLGLLDQRLGNTHVLSIPWRDISGSVVGFSFRTIDGSEPKYLNLRGFKKSESIVGIDLARFWCKQTGSAVVLVCEGVLDALHWNSRIAKGLRDDALIAVAIGGTEISKEQWEMLHSLEATICLALDNDESGKKATEKLARSFADGSNILVAEYPDGVKDLDELLVKDKLGELELVPIQRWLVRRIGSKYNDSEIGRSQGLKECLSIASFTTGLAREYFVDEITRMFGYDRKVVEQELERRDVKETRNIALDVIKDLKKSQNEPERVREVLEEGLKKLKLRTPQIEAYTFEKYVEELKDITEGYETGFKRLDELVRIRPGTVTVIAGRPRHGKTSLMLNILVRMINKYPDKSFYFFSYELPRSLITTMILMILAGKVLDEKHNVDRYIEYIKTLHARD